MRSTIRHFLAASLFGAAALAMPSRAVQAQTLETETARTLPQGVVTVAGNLELQHAAEGSEYAVPFAFEVGLTERLELLVEPVAYTAIRPKTGSRASGAGDIETTLTYLVAQESLGRPAFAVAGELKIPTARNSLIGTGKTDVAAYLIASKRFGRADIHANLGYTIVGQPMGAGLSNIVSGAAAMVLTINQKNEIFAEVLANTAALAEGDGALGSPAPVVAEAPAGEVVGTIGVARNVSSNLQFFVGLSYDNNNAVQIHPGIVWRLR